MKSREVRGAKLRSAELEITAFSWTEAKAPDEGDCSRRGRGREPPDLEGGSRRGGTFFCRQPVKL